MIKCVDMGDGEFRRRETVRKKLGEEEKRTLFHKRRPKLLFLLAADVASLGGRS